MPNFVVKICQTLMFLCGVVAMLANDSFAASSAFLAVLAAGEISRD